MKDVRCFISSPGDVGEERLIAQRVVERLGREFSRRLRLTPILWEHEPLRATSHFQSQIIPPSQADIVICVLWSRLGTRLPIEFRRPDGTPYESGTEWEFEDAAQAFREHGTPDLLVYRKTSEPTARLTSRESVLTALAQKEALDRFVDRWFGNPIDGFRAAFHSFSAADDFERLLETHLRRFLAEKYGAQPLTSYETTAPEIPIENPFRGLSPFDCEHSAIFFGRTRAVTELKQQLENQAARGNAFVLVVGMSGSGKSSLVRAGLIPTITQPGVVEGVGVWRYGVIRPADVSGGLCQCLGAALTQATALPNLSEFGFAADQAASLLRQNPQLMLGPVRGALNKIAAEIATSEKLKVQPTPRLLLAIDQLEELFTIPDQTDAERQAFVDALATFARSGDVWIVATLRSDYFPRLAELPSLIELKSGNGQFDVLPPTFAELEQMIVLPARVAGVGFEVDPQSNTGLNQMIHEAACKQPESLPLLEFTLDELFKRHQDNVLTLAAYRQLGGLEGAIARRAEEVFAALPAEAQSALPALWHGLIALAEGEQTTAASRRTTRRGLSKSPGLEQLIEALVSARLLVVDRDESGEQTIGLAHEALLRHWPRAANWIDENQELLRIRSRVSAAAALWESRNRDPDFLLTGSKPLADAEALRRQVSNLPASVREYIESSWTAAAQAMRAKKRRIAAIVASFLILVVTFGVYSFVQWRHADSLRHLAEKRRRDAERQEQLAEDRERDANLAKDAARNAELKALDAQAAAEEARLEERSQRMAKEDALQLEKEQRLRKEEALAQAEFNLTFRNPSLADRDWRANDVAAALRWLSQTPPEMRQWEWFHIHNKCLGYFRSAELGQSIQALHFAPRGVRMLVTMGPDWRGEPPQGTLSVWDWDAGKKIIDLVGHTAPPRAAVLVDRGEQAVSASLREVIVWNVDEGRTAKSLAIEGAEAVALSDDGRYLAELVPFVRELSNNEPAFNVIVRDVQSGEEIGEWMINGFSGDDMALSRDGEMIAVAYDNHSFQLFRRGQSKPLLTSPAEGEDAIHRAIFALDISPNGDYLAVGRLDGSVSVWSIAEKRLLSTASSQDSAVVALRFFDDSQSLAGAGWDRTIRVWQADSGLETHVMRGHQDWVMAIAVTASGNTLVSGGRDGELKLWNLRGEARAVKRFDYMGYEMIGAGWSADERRFHAAVFADDGPRIVVGDLSNGRRYLGGAYGYTFLATSPDNQIAVSAIPDDGSGTLTVWNIGNRGVDLLRELNGHALAARCGAFIDARRFVSGAADRSLILWDLTSGDMLNSMDLENEPTAICYHPLTRSLYAVDSQRTLTEIDVESWQVKHRWAVEFPVWALAADPIAARLAVAGGWDREPGELEIWQLGDAPQQMLKIAGHTDRINCLAYHPAGARLASGSNDMSVRLWDTTRGGEALSLTGHRHEVKAVQFSQSGCKLLSGSRDGTVIIWDATPQSLQDRQ